jgi:hypothetical protein
MLITSDEKELSTKLKIDITKIKDFQIIFLPENINLTSDLEDLSDSMDSIMLCKLAKEKGILCTNSYELGLNTKIIERRSIDIWLGTIWIRDHFALPLLVSVLSKVFVDTVQNKVNPSKGKESCTVHSNVKLSEGKISAEIDYKGDSETFLKILEGVNQKNTDAGK